MQYFQSASSQDSPYQASSLPEGFRASKRDQTAPQRNKPKVTSQGNLLYGGIRYASRSEAACAILMQRYIPGFKIKDGKTFQVPIGVSSGGHLRTADFMVQDVLVEYHPPRIHKSSKKPGDFKNWQEYNNYRAVYNRCSPGQKVTLKKLTELKLTRNYTEKRLEQITQGLEHQGRELIVATSAADFYDKVLKRFAGPNLPDKESVLREFRIATRKPTELGGRKRSKGQKREKRSRRNPGTRQTRRSA